MDYFNEGNRFYNLKEYKNAIDCYKLSIDKYENVACSLYNSGVCYIKLKDFNNAISMIKKALELQKESKYFFNLAYCYAMLEDTNKALIYFNIAWSLDDSDNDCEKAIKLIMSKKKKAL
ncbi:tetratricopeptide repeat protein [Clostridium septicum]|uniref:peptidylprolyl isomerase n=1 Tax=Clostridium septicum TaxID=1504 RepID=A0A9N7JMV5_CLOSE|nr:tetratricopeptide repeat protein [Clostridium septicum]AYE35528.1 tetratricopeptide repeat-containing protein [Clostridium septicum]MDU1314580.1 tetratricopeptide repeat protein [Clostridium septicum]QAS60914.1 tetratricopeptide repeat protein [Clostridium septicum]UEC19812.1 tetratricopeptide repeat protein [Clostridium septicum]USS02128.1 tetratricopeptide repeat protein [Clostridium septicum]